MFACLECGRKFRTAGAAEKASMNGCPKCGGVDIDIDVPSQRPEAVAHNPVLSVRLTVRYHQPIGALDGTRNHYVTVERFAGEDDAVMIRKAIRAFREPPCGDRWHRIESVNLYPGRWNVSDAVAIDAQDNIVGAPNTAA